MKARTLVAVGLLFVACGGGEPHFVAKDLARIMPSASDAPAGTRIDASNAGPKTMDEFVTDTKVRIELDHFGFRVAYVASFSTPNYVPDPEKAPVGSAFYGTSAILLRDATSGGLAFRFYSERLRTRAKNLTTIVVGDLGAEAFSFRFSSLDDTPLPGLAILWRVGDALFSVVGVGNPSPDPAVTRGLAATIDRRARA